MVDNEHSANRISFDNVRAILLTAAVSSGVSFASCRSTVLFILTSALCRFALAGLAVGSVQRRLCVCVSVCVCVCVGV